MAVVLLGDIGGTSSRLSLERISAFSSEQIKAQTYPSTSYSTLTDIIIEFLAGEPAPKLAVIGIAGIVDNGSFDISNVSWPPTSETEIQEICGIEIVKLLNDFEAAGYGVLELTEDQLIALNSPTHSDVNAPKCVIGPGTGLGESLLTPFGDGLYKVWPSEGGHCDFGPKSELEWRYAKYIM
jgi:glucokinase